MSSDVGGVASALVLAGPEVSPTSAVELPNVTGSLSVMGRSYMESPTTRALANGLTATHMDLSGYWLTFVDEQLLELLAIGQSQPPARRRR